MLIDPLRGLHRPIYTVTVNEPTDTPYRGVWELSSAVIADGAAVPPQTQANSRF